MASEFTRSKGAISLTDAVFIQRGRPRTNFFMGALVLLLGLLLLVFIAGEPDLRTWQLIVLDLFLFGVAGVMFAASKQAASPTDFRIAAFKNGVYIRPDPLLDEQLYMSWESIEKIVPRRITVGNTRAGYSIAFITKGADQRSKHEGSPSVQVEAGPSIARKLEALRTKYAA